WCNQRHNVPYVFPETQQSDNFIPSAALMSSGFNFGQPVLGRTTVSFTAMDPHAPSQHIVQWTLSSVQSLDRATTLELRYLRPHTWSKNLSDAPDFRSPMFEASIPQDNNYLAAEKGPGCDIRHRFALSAVYALPALPYGGALHAVTKDWTVSSVYQIQTGFPFTVSVFGDTANSGTVLGENPVRANYYTGQSIFPSGTRTANRWFNTAAFAAPAAFTFGDVGRNSIYGPGLETLD